MLELWAKHIEANIIISNILLSVTLYEAVLTLENELL